MPIPTSMAPSHAGPPGRSESAVCTEIQPGSVGLHGQPGHRLMASDPSSVTARSSVSCASCCPPFAILHHPSSIPHPPSSVIRPPSAMLHPPPAVCCLLTACCMLSWMGRAQKWTVAIVVIGMAQLVSGFLTKAQETLGEGDFC